MSNQDVDVDALIRGSSSRKRWFIFTGAVVIVVAAVVTFLAVQDEETDVVIAPQRVEVMTGQLSTTIELSGVAASVQTSNLSFGLAGEILAVEVVAGNEVTAGQILARFDNTQAELELREAELNLKLKQAELAEVLLNGSTAAEAAADYAAAAQAVANAELRAVEAQADIDALLDGLTQAEAASDRATAIQSVANAEVRVAEAQTALDTLLDGPTEAEVAKATRDVASKEVSLIQAQEALTTLEAGPTAEKIAEAELAIAGAENDILESAEALASATGAMGTGVSLAELVTGDSSATENAVLTILTTNPNIILTLQGVGIPQTSAKKPSAQFTVDQNALIQTRSALEDLLTGPSAADLKLARHEVELAETALDQAREDESGIISWQLASQGTTSFQDSGLGDDLKLAQLELAAEKAAHVRAEAVLTDLLSTDESTDLELARLKLAAEETALIRAEESLAELVAGPSSSDIAAAELAVARAELTLEQARVDLEACTLVAPFDGVIESVDIEVGDSVGQNTRIFVIMDRSSITIELTVTEANVLELKAGQVGLATFDAIDGVEYPIRITTVSHLPSIDQGVVTYPIEAMLLTRNEIPEVAAELVVLSNETSDFAVAGGGRASGNPGSNGSANTGGRGGDGGMSLRNIELPEGVTLRQVILALANNEPLPAGVTLPEGFEIPEQLRSRLAGNNSATTPERTENRRPMPAPGMSANSTILTQVREEAILIPVSTVRQAINLTGWNDGEFFVTVPAANDATERVAVEIGSSDGINVEILSGLQVGDTVLIGADSGGIAFSATQQTQQQLPNQFRPGSGNPGSPQGRPQQGGGRR